jgi:osmotically-inducible protein OsmY
MGNLHPATAAEMIKELKVLIVTPEQEQKTQLLIKDMVMAQKVVQHILYDQKIAVHFLEALALDNAVTLRGVANSQAVVEAAISAAREVPLVRSVQSEIQVVQEYSVMP